MIGFWTIIVLFVGATVWVVVDGIITAQRYNKKFKKNDTLFLESMIQEMLEIQSKKHTDMADARNMRTLRATALQKSLELQDYKRSARDLLGYLYDESAYKAVIAEDDTLEKLTNKLL